MDQIEEKIHRLTQSQLNVLLLFAKSNNGIISPPHEIRGKTGKALGGIFSSLARQKINGERLITAWGRNEKGQLKWKLNSKLISKEKLLKITQELLSV